VPERYDDGGFTGANLERPAFQRLMDDMDAGKVDILVVYKVDRLSRSLLDFAQVMRRFNAADVSFVSVTQNFNTADAMGRLTLNILFSFAQFEREMISERTRDKVAAARRRGKWTGGPVPLGYDVVDKKLIINELEADTIREMFRLYLERCSGLEVMKELNRQGRATKRHISKNGRVRQARAWSKDAVLRTLKNPIYRGMMPYKDESFPGDHEAIISPQDFAQAQAILSGNYTPKRKAAQNPAYILRGLLRCECCGAAYTPGSTRRRGTEYRYYRCVTRDKQGKDACPSKPLPAQAIEDFVCERIRQAVRTGDLNESVADWLLHTAAEHKARFERERKLLPQKIAQLSAEGKGLIRKLDEMESESARTMIEQSLEEVGRHLSAKQARLAEVEKALLELEDAELEARWVADTVIRFDDVWDHLNPTNRGRLVQAIIHEVVVNEPKNRVSATLADIAMPELPPLPDDDALDGRPRLRVVREPEVRP
jgi:DNA invertase Pin-like site-specific DNA recombinase